MIIVNGRLESTSEDVAALKDALGAMEKASRAEDGCILYAFAEDVLQPGVIRISEKWESWDALKAHGATDHMATWRAALADIEILGRDVVAFEMGEIREL